MRNWKRRLLAMLLAMLMILPLLVACDEGEDPTPEGGPDDGKTESTEKEIDIYFIAGQSNAAGSTVIKNADEIYADYPELKTGTNPYILYAGNSAGNSPNNTVTYDWGSVKLGLGASSTKMGPEVGMAKELSKYYNAETGKVAGIIKYAHGGTGLANTEANGNRDGNWSPPSYSEHDPDDPDLAYKGFLYRGFVEEAEKRLYELKEMGYTKINIKGLYWMQGCNDTWRYTTGESTSSKSSRWYPAAFACLVTDWRNDLKEIMRDLQGNYGGAQDMPFFIGTISPTYSLKNVSVGTVWTDDGTDLATAEARNLPFIAMQKKLAEDNANCYIINNDAYVTVRCERIDDTTMQYTMVGTDQSHWNQADCYQIGKNVGAKLLDICTDYQA